MESGVVVKNYSKKIGKRYILKNINLDLKLGKVYGLKGINGSGKSMLMRAMSGMMFPTEGEVIVKGVNITKEKKVADGIGVLIETPGFILNKSGCENLLILADINKKIDKETIKKYMDKFNLDYDDDRKVREYSLGMKQKLGIIQAIMEDQEIIFLDEPINALDEEAIREFNREITKLKDKGKLIVISNHNLNELKNVCDEILEIRNGEIIEFLKV